MAKETVFKTVNENVAGIDIGAEMIFVSPDGVEAVSFETFTSGYNACIKYLQSKMIDKVAMEATGKNIAIGSFMRKLRGRKDSGIAIKAGARKLAMAYYNTLTKGAAYVEQGTKLYEEQIKRREIAALKKLAKKYNMQLSDNQKAA